MENLSVAFENQEILRHQIPADSLAVNEIFLSIQGEGKHTGIPMVFVRTNLCRVGCRFCDTKYTWEFISHNTFYTPQQLLEKIVSISPKCRNVCITGGEPLEQADALFAACQHLTYNSFRVHIETSGSIIIPKNFVSASYWIVCSPKQFNGANFDSPIKEVKLLVTRNADVKKLESWVSRFSRFRNYKNRIWVSIQPIEPNPLKVGNPEGLSEEQMRTRELEFEHHKNDVAAEWRENIDKAIEICKLTGWQLSMQQHKFLRIR